MWPNPQETADLVTFTEAVLKGKLHFLWVLIFCKISKNHWTVTSLSYEKAWCMGKMTGKRWFGLWFLSPGIKITRIQSVWNSFGKFISLKKASVGVQHCDVL